MFTILSINPRASGGGKVMGSDCVSLYVDV